MLTFFEKLIKPFPVEMGAQPPKGFIAFCNYYTKGTGWFLVIMSVSAAAVAVMEVSLFAFLGQLVDWLASKNPQSVFQDEKEKLIWMGFVLIIALPIVIIFHSLIIHQSLLGNYPMRIRWQGHRYLLGQSIAFYQDELAGRIAAKLMQTALAVREAVMKLLDVMVYISVYFGSVLVVAASSDVRLSLPLIIWIMLYILILFYFVPRLQRISNIQADARSEMTGRIVDTYTNISTVKLFSHSKREAEYAQDSMESFLKTVYSQMRLVTLLNISVWIINILLIFFTTVVSVWLWSQSAVTIGVIAAAIALVLRLHGMSQWIMWEVSSIFENIGTVQDGMKMLSKEQEVTDKPISNALLVESGKIEFTGVQFHYGKGAGVIDNFSLTIQPGEKVGLVGRSGAGKSTLVSLLLRFHDLEGGQILIDGQDIAQVKQESLRAQIAVVTQDTSLLHRSVRDNIMYGKPNATEESMVDAAMQAKAHEFILDLKDARGRSAYDAYVGERGVKLSGGQRQRIAVARVLLKDAPILILDEATSALDSEVESAIQENLYKLMEGKTVIAIAHRLSTIAALDRLVVLDKGNIVEQGAHKSLIQKNGLYAQLWAHQSGGFLGEEAA